MKLRNKKREKNIIYEFQITAIGILAFLLIMSISILLIYQKSITEIKNDEKVYQRHYLFIEQDQTNTLTNQVFQEAKEHGEEKGVYVERLEEMSFSDYTTEDYLKMAIAMKVDGIILEGENDAKICEIINQASEEKIPVVTVLTDCKDSKRQSFIEIGTYNLGREYGRWIINVAKSRKQKALLLTSSGIDSGNQNMIYTGIRETLNNEGNHLDVQLETEILDSVSQFGAAVRIREILVDEENRPDIIMCTDEQETEAVYQTLIDQNLVGKVTVIGYCISDTILKAIDNKGIAATMNVDTRQMGALCVDVLDDYIEYGHVSDYIMVDTNVVTRDNLKRYIKNEENK